MLSCQPPQVRLLTQFFTFFSPGALAQNHAEHTHSRALVTARSAGGRAGKGNITCNRGPPPLQLPGVFTLPGSKVSWLSVTTSCDPLTCACLSFL
ncbi:hypothetical protein I79_002408 [Cricetulus griseus]|uniref:Uncharacterized protein n=1 Tax=Cricetulus griseus TaxID=10029 RepID=G3GXB8_CRIGR|nr:hypothetical protein I79_002408 [Cricetulus griseus]